MSVFRNPDPAERARIGRENVRAAYAAPDASAVIESGDWYGFTRGDALAWCWNLYQYEPHGFVHPASEVRMRRERQLEEGNIPAGGGYAARARTFVERGVTPQQYREASEVLGSATFSWSDVSYC